MSRFNPFNNDKPAIYFIWAFIIAFIVLLALTSRAEAETEFEYGATFVHGKYSDGSAIFFSETWDGKYLIGLGLIGDQEGTWTFWRPVSLGHEVPIKEVVTMGSNMLVHAQRLVTYKKVTLGLGVAKWQHTNKLIGDELGFSLSIRVRLGNNIGLSYRHFSNGGTATPNTGQDILLIGYRF